MTFEPFQQSQEKNMCGSGYPIYPKFLSPTLNFFLQILKLKRIAEQNHFVLLLFSNFRIWRKNTYQSDHLKGNSKSLCIQSLILEIKGLKQGYVFEKNRPSPFYISFVIFNTFLSRSEYSLKKGFQKK